MIYQSTLTSKGQVTIPVEIRRLLGLKPSDKVTFVREDKSVIVKKGSDFLSLRGSLKSKKKFSDEIADKAISKHIGEEYERKLKRC